MAWHFVSCQWHQWWVFCRDCLIQVRVFFSSWLTFHSAADHLRKWRTDNLVFIRKELRGKGHKTNPFPGNKSSKKTQTKKRDLFRQEMCVYLFWTKTSYPDWIWELVWVKKRKSLEMSKWISLIIRNWSFLWFLKPVARELTYNILICKSIRWTWTRHLLTLKSSQRPSEIDLSVVHQLKASTI